MLRNSHRNRRLHVDEVFPSTSRSQTFTYEIPKMEDQLELKFLHEQASRISSDEEFQPEIKIEPELVPGTDELLDPSFETDPLLEPDPLREAQPYLEPGLGFASEGGDRGPEATSADDVNADYWSESSAESKYSPGSESEAPSESGSLENDNDFVTSVKEDYVQEDKPAITLTERTPHPNLELQIKTETELMIDSMKSELKSDCECGTDSEGAPGKSTWDYDPGRRPSKASKTKTPEMKGMDFKAISMEQLTRHSETQIEEKLLPCDEYDSKTVEMLGVMKHKGTHKEKKMFVCDHCYYPAGSLSRLRWHVRCHTGEKPYACYLCEYRSGWKSNLQTHMRCHTDERPYPCDLCERRFKNKAHMVRHTKTHTGKKHQCIVDGCKFKTNVKPTMERHLQTHKETFDTCDFKTGKTLRLKRRRRTRIGNTKYRHFVCYYCKYKAKEKATLNRHIKECHVGENPIAFAGSELQTNRKSNMERPMMGVHTAQELFDSDVGEIENVHIEAKTFMCYHCNYRAKYKSMIERHMRCHSRDKPFVCGSCGLRSNHRSAIKRHVLRVHAKNKLVIHRDVCNRMKMSLIGRRNAHIEEKKFVCDHCNYESSCESNLREHMKYHADEKQAACDSRDYQEFRGTLHFEGHMKTHSRKEQLVCSTCGYRTVRKVLMERHKMIHLDKVDPKLLTCYHCNHQAKSKLKMLRHMSSHNGEKPFECVFCEYQSRFAYNMRIHMRSHTGEKPFACESCEYRSSTKAHMLRHKRLIHNEKK